MSAADHSLDDQLDGYLAVQQYRPANRQLYQHPDTQRLVTGKRNAPAAHVDHFAVPDSGGMMARLTGPGMARVVDRRPQGHGNLVALQGIKPHCYASTPVVVSCVFSDAGWNGKTPR